MIAVIGILAMLAVPMISGANETTTETKDKANAKHVESVSQSLAAIGVAHVIPESLGGIEATIRLLRAGVVVSQGPFAGQTFMLRSLSDREVSGAARHLSLIYDEKEIRLTYSGSDWHGSVGSNPLVPALALLH